MLVEGSRRERKRERERERERERDGREKESTRILQAGHLLAYNKANAPFRKPVSRAHTVAGLAYVYVDYRLLL